MAADDAAVVVTLRANLKDYEAALKTAVRQTERAAQAAEKAVSGIGKGAKANFAPLNDNFQKSAGQIANDARVLQFQLNDIFSGLASGQGIRAVQQQLGQIAQQLGGGGLAAGARTLGSAMLSMVNPINLAVVAFGFAASAAANYFFGAENDAKDSEAALKKHADAINEIKQRWGDVLPGIKAYIEEIQHANDAVEKLAARQKLLSDALDKVKDVAADVGDSIIEVQGTLELAGQSAVAEQLRKAWEAYRTEIEKGNDGAQQLVTLNAAIAAAAATGVQGIDQLVAKIRQDLTPALRQAGDAVDTIKQGFDGLPRSLGGIGTGQVGSRAGNDALQGLGAAFQAEQLRNSNKELAKSIALIRQFEGGLVAVAKQQEKGGAFRAGFSSDTLTDPATGAFRAVRAGDVVNVEQAYADLTRRIRDGRVFLSQQIGQAVFADLNDDQKAVLDSLVYNYGKNIKTLGPVFKKIREGELTGAAETIATLATGPHSPEALRKRRQEEARVFAGGSLREQKQSYDDLVTSINTKIDAQGRENAISGDSVKSSDDKTAALAREKAAQEAATVAKQLNDAAVAQGITLTDEVRAKNQALAESYAAAGLKAEELSLRNDRLADAHRKAAAEATRLSEAEKQARLALANTLASMATGALTGFIQDLRNGVSAADALYNAISRIADQLLSMALNMAFQKLFGSLLGGLGGAPGLFAAGGYTGDISKNRPAGIVHGKEFVVNAAATQKHRGLLEAINKGVPGYASGGFVLPRMGGQMMQSAQQAAPQVNTRTTVVNTFDAGSFLSEALSRPDGVNVILNAVRAQPGAFRQAMQA